MHYGLEFTYDYVKLYLGYFSNRNPVFTLKNLTKFKENILGEVSKKSVEFYTL